MFFQRAQAKLPTAKLYSVVCHSCLNPLHKHMVPRISNFLAALLTMAVYEGAFITEHVRGSIQPIEAAIVSVI